MPPARVILRKIYCERTKSFKLNSMATKRMIKKLALKLSSIIFVSVFIFGCSQNYDPEYKRTENHNGIVSYYFESDNSPRLEPENNFDSLEQLKYVLSLIIDLPNFSLNSFKKSGRHTFTNKLADDSEITVRIKQCNKKTSQYSCIEKVTYRPNSKDMAIAKAKKYPQTYLFVSEDQYSDVWPYLFGFGLLECNRYRDVVIHANNKVYAVNGKAMGAKRRDGTKMYHNAWNVRKKYFETGRIPPPSELIQKGLGLCKH
jgi:hypothetical protein